MLRFVYPRPEIAMDTSLRPMSTSQVLDRTFFLYRKNFVLFAGIALITPMLTTLASLSQLATFGVPVKPEMSGPDPMAAWQATMGRAVAGGIISLVIYMIGYAITTGATIQAVSMLHLGRSTTIKESYGRVKPIWGKLLLLVIRVFWAAAWPLILCYAVLIASALTLMILSRGGAGNMGAAAGLGLVMLVVMVGFLAATVWGVIAYCRYALAVPACAIENLPIKYALIRSKFLTKGNLGRVFAVYILTLVITVAIQTLLQVPLYISGNFSFRTGLNFTPAVLVWTYASSFIGAMVAGPIASIAMALVYYDERVRKEAFDLQLMMEAMRPGEATQAAAAQAAQ